VRWVCSTPRCAKPRPALARVRSDAGTAHALALITLGQIRLERGEHAARTAAAGNRRARCSRGTRQRARAWRSARTCWAQLHSQQGRYADAERYYASALATVRERLPGDSPRRAEYINNLARQQGARRDLAGAEVLLHQQAVDILRRTRGSDHPQTARALAALGQRAGDARGLRRRQRHLSRGRSGTTAPRSARRTPDLAQTLGVATPSC
jgi:hypothetical protein